tara:strand:- start:278 stop:556 length:279 start_codon:yes stop_codon:yes gene_type:complete
MPLAKEWQSSPETGPLMKPALETVMIWAPPQLHLRPHPLLVGKPLLPQGVLAALDHPKRLAACQGRYKGCKIALRKIEIPTSGLLWHKLALP